MRTLLILLLLSTAAQAKVPWSCIKEHELAHAAGWGPTHPGAIRPKRCGGIEMPPHAFAFQPGVVPQITYMSPEEIVRHCSPFFPDHRILACSDVGGDRPHVYLPYK